MSFKRSVAAALASDYGHWWAQQPSVIAAYLRGEDEATVRRLEGEALQAERDQGVPPWLRGGITAPFGAVITHTTCSGRTNWRITANAVIFQFVPNAEHPRAWSYKLQVRRNGDHQARLRRAWWSQASHEEYAGEVARVLHVAQVLGIQLDAEGLTLNAA